MYVYGPGVDGAADRAETLNPAPALVVHVLCEAGQLFHGQRCLLGRALEETARTTK